MTYPLEAEPVQKLVEHYTEIVTMRHPHHSDRFLKTDQVVLVTKMSPAATLGGRGLLSKLNRDVLDEIFGENLAVLELVPRPIGGAMDAAQAFLGQIDGIDRAAMDRLFTLVQSAPTRQVFIDGSNLGEIARGLKQRFPGVEIVTFFHNVEARFFLGSLRQTRRLRALGILLTNYLAERKAVRNSDKIICLSVRDSRLLKKVYGRGATHIAPMALEDKCPAPYAVSPASKPEPFALFVGGTFFANQAGIAWFVKAVVPRIDLPIYVVGRGFETMRAELEVPGKVTVVGAVDSLVDWYRRAKFVIAPIFDGSGMKTKVAEALMYGKKVVGTPEAFSGYEEIVERAGWVCSTADEFVTAINIAKSEVSTSFDAGLRDIYLQRYSFAAAQERLGAILMAKK